MVSHLASQNGGGAVEGIGAYMFRNVFFSKHISNDEILTNHPSIQQFNIQALLKTKHSTEISDYNVRSKLIVIPKRVLIINVHIVNEFLPIQDPVAKDKSNSTDKNVAIATYSLYKVEYTTGLLFHYRSGGNVEAENIEDKRMLNFVDDLVGRVESVHGSVS
jgi:hypothetical protein